MIDSVNRSVNGGSCARKLYHLIFHPNHHHIRISNLFLIDLPGVYLELFGKSRGKNNNN